MVSAGFGLNKLFGCEGAGQTRKTTNRKKKLPESGVDQLRQAPNKERRPIQASTTLTTRTKSGRTSGAQGPFQIKHLKQLQPVS